MLDCQRSLFDIPEDISYLNCSYLAPRLHAVNTAATAALEKSKQPWTITAPDFFNDREVARQLFAQIINASADDIAIIPAASYGIATACLNITLEAGQNIVLLAEEFPSNVYAWRELAKQQQANIVTVANPKDGDWTQALLSAIDEHTGVVAIVPCHWTDGGIVNLKAISVRCRELAVPLVIDATQALGVMPFSVQDVDADFVISALYKWMLGPYSLGMMYVNPRHHNGKALEHNWINRKDSNNFANLINYQDEFANGARRFDVGESSNFILMPMAIAAMQQILTWGINAINNRLACLTDQIAEQASSYSIKVKPKQLRSAHIIGLSLPNDNNVDVLAELKRYGVYVSLRGESLRVSPHVYNTQDDINKLFDLLTKIL